jgi:hypothetical protein
MKPYDATRYLLLLSVPICFSACHRDDPAARWRVGPEEYKIYKAVIDESCISLKSSLIVIRRELVTALKIETGIFQKRVDRWLSRDFNRKGGGVRELQARFPLEVPYRLVSTKEIDSIFNLARGKHVMVWKVFADRFPGANGCIEFSPIGFNERGNLAVVDYAVFGGMSCNERVLVLLERREEMMGTWNVIGKEDFLVE